MTTSTPTALASVLARLHFSQSALQNARTPCRQEDHGASFAIEPSHQKLYARFPHVTVKPFKIKPHKLDFNTMLTFMAVDESSALLLYGRGHKIFARSIWSEAVSLITDTSGGKWQTVISRRLNGTCSPCASIRSTLSWS
jgi:hypothetical protein